jgi:hypothetical protein
MSNTDQQPKKRQTHEQDERERLIRERAYFIWEQEGRPEGRHLEHWRRARTYIDEENGTGPWAERGC